MGGRRHDERPDHLHGCDRQRRARADRVHRVHPRPGMGRLQPHLAAARGVVPHAVRPRGVHHRRRGGRRGGRVLFGPHRGLTIGRRGGGRPPPPPPNPPPRSFPPRPRRAGLAPPPPAPPP